MNYFKIEIIGSTERSHEEIANYFASVREEVEREAGCEIGGVVYQPTDEYGRTIPLYGTDTHILCTVQIPIDGDGD